MLHLPSRVSTGQRKANRQHLPHWRHDPRLRLCWACTYRAPKAARHARLSFPASSNRKEPAASRVITQPLCLKSRKLFATIPHSRLTEAIPPAAQPARASYSQQYLARSRLRLATVSEFLCRLLSRLIRLQVHHDIQHVRPLAKKPPRDRLGDAVSFTY